MKVFLTGATGFVGSRLVSLLLEAGHDVEALVRSQSVSKLSAETLNHPSFHVIQGDLADAGSTAKMSSECEGVIHLAGIFEEDRKTSFEQIHAETTRCLVEAATRAEVACFILMSALGVREQTPSQFLKSKFQAEHILRASGLPSVIFRPSLIFRPGDGTIRLRKRYVSVAALDVVPGPGTNLFQPVSLDNVTQGILKALSGSEFLGRVYEIGGPDRLSFNTILDRIQARGGGGSRLKVHPPIWLMKPVVGVLELIPGFPLNRDQIVMLQEDHVCAARRFFDDFNIEPQAFNIDESSNSRPDAAD